MDKQIAVLKIINIVENLQKTLASEIFSRIESRGRTTIAELSLDVMSRKE